MTRAQYFFDIPVYRLSEDRYYAEMREWIDQKLYPGPPERKEFMRAFYKQNPGKEESTRQGLRQSYGGSWFYNEIVGYIRLFFLDSQLRGEYYRVIAKKIVKTRKKVIEPRIQKLAPEIDIPDNATSGEIFALVIEYLDDCARELKTRHVDKSLLVHLEQHLDWRGLYERSCAAYQAGH